MEVFKLSEEEKSELIRINREIKDKKSGDRIKALLMMDKGYRNPKIAELLLLDERTIGRWRKGYPARKNITNFLFHNCEGYLGKLSKENKTLLSQYVIANLISDSKQIRAFIQDRFQISYSKSGIISLLHELGFRYKQTSILPSKMNAEHQAEFKKNYEEFSGQLKEDETIVFMDGMHPTHNVETGKAWIKVGEKKEVLSNSGRQRCNLNGFYNPFTQDVFAKNYASINAQATIDSFKELQAFYPNKSTIYVIIDNARYYKNAIVKEWLKTSRIETIYLPPYSPNLNLIERFWKCLKKHVMLNIYYSTFAEFKRNILEFCNRGSPEHRALLKKSVGSKLHLLKSA